ncbi:uncharacterized protein LOC9644099 [Selaginella moellendorffii]|uniref:uncharacterized protein LOC9644099 n=1 Tax=Selaginella moellendorffii TaxID=88036 RepID=UPI000D1CDFCF|nr:uncharacterized protein LOC9644099 [Selaginella moellendorffii]|eukprot:XP_024521271.1 uncharacterized protein LOC9644099 [Selaginella moellendorffii]
MAAMAWCAPGRSLAPPPWRSQQLENRPPARFHHVRAAAGRNFDDQQPMDAEPNCDSDERLRSGPFSFVTDNASSRGSLQMPNEPWQDGNVGVMMSQIKDKGRDFGSFMDVGEFSWFVRETGSKSAKKGTIVFLHGAPSQSYSYRNVMAQMADAGYRCIAPDWLGFGLSQAPQPVFRFSYTEEAYHEELNKVLAQVEVESPFILVTQGFLVGSFGLTWALKNTERVSKLVILNTPLTPSAPLPGLFNQLRLPFLGEFISQDAMMAEKFIEKGSAYVLKVEKADVYRLPYLGSSGPGFALLEAARKVSFPSLMSTISAGFKSWSKPTLVAWGQEDKYLPKTQAMEFEKLNPDVIRTVLMEGAGHMPQEDWPEKVVEALAAFL